MGYAGTAAATYTARQPTASQGTLMSELAPEVDVDWRQMLQAVAEQRDRVAYAKLFRHFAPRLRAFGMRQLGQEQLALEMVQEAMLAVWTKAHLYSPEKGAPSTWIFTIARNQAYDMLRRKASRPEDIGADDLWPVLADPDGDDEYLQPEHLVMRQQLARYYSLLNPSQLQVIQMVYLQEMSQQEVAEALNIPLGTVKSRLRLAVQKLREGMNEGSSDEHDL